MGDLESQAVTQAVIIPGKPLNSRTKIEYLALYDADGQPLELGGGGEGGDSPRLPSTNEKAALAGTSAPSAGNKYVNEAELANEIDTRTSQHSTLVAVVQDEIDDRATADNTVANTAASNLSAAVSTLEAVIQGETDDRVAADTAVGNAASTALGAHISDATDAHDASAISFVPTGSIAASDVQAAVAEVASESSAAISALAGEVDDIVGIPNGGLTGQLLAKNTSGDGDVEWVDPPSGGGEGDGVDSVARASISDHLSDSTDAHDASAISFTPAGSIGADDVQEAISEVATDAASALSTGLAGKSNTGHGHAATEITYAGGTGMSATNVEAAIDELATEKTDDTTVNAHISDATDAHAASAIGFTPTGNIAATDAQTAIAEVATDAASALTTGLATKTDDTAVTAHISDATDAHAASAIGFTPTGTIAATTAQTAIAEVATDAASALTAGLATKTDDTAITAHISDASAAHAASAISYAGGTGMSATDVEAAIDELATEKANDSALTAHISDATDAHAASAIGFTPTGTIAATTAQTAIAEVATDAASALTTGLAGKTDDTAVNAHIADTTAAHAASSIGFTPTGTIAASDAQAAIAEVASEAASALTTGLAGKSDTSHTHTGLTVQAAGTPSVRAIGTTSTTAAAGDDARLSDTRTPTDASVTLAKIATALKATMVGYNVFTSGSWPTRPSGYAFIIWLGGDASSNSPSASMVTNDLWFPDSE